MSTPNASTSLSALTLFRGITADPILRQLRDTLCTLSSLGEREFTESSKLSSIMSDYAEIYTGLMHAQQSVKPSLTAHIAGLLRVSENLFSREAAMRDSSPERMDPALEAATKRELELLRQVLYLPAAVFTSPIASATGVTMPEWITDKPISTDAWYRELFAQHQKNGYGQFSEHHAFVWKNGQLVPVSHPDPILRSGLFSYEYEISRIDENTQKLIDGKIAENLLLFGARGTGKSSAVKAMVNSYRDDGLRLIEIDQDSLLSMADLLEYLSSYLHTKFTFLLFIDDLVFMENDKRYNALKTLLEGGMKTRPRNTVIYATSNRRHFVAEKNDRELYAGDARNEKLSLSDRFGIAIRFASATKDVYVSIVRGILADRNLSFDPETIDDISVKWAMRENGFSPRTAKQFCDYYQYS